MSQQGFRDRETKHVYACDRCGSQVRLACNLVPDEHGSKRNDGFVLVCGCMTVTGDVTDPDTLPPNWIIDLDFEVAH